MPAFLAGVCALYLPSPSALAQPVNDFCSGALPLVDGDNLVDTKLSTLDTQIPCNRAGPAASGPEVWYYYVAPVTGIRNFTITSFRRNSPTAGGTRDSELTIYDACGGNVLACDDDSGMAAYSKIYHFPVTAGTRYVVRVGNWGPAVTELNKGIGTLNIAPPPVHHPMDDCDMATVVAGGAPGQPLSLPFTTVGMTNSDTQGWDCDNMRKDGWFAWTPAASGIAAVDGCAAGGSNDINGLVLGIYTACDQPPLVCNNAFQDAPNTFCIPKVCFPVNAGQTYLIRYGVQQDTQDATGNINVEVRPANAGISIPANAIPEPGSCSDTLANDQNGGCNTTPNAFTDIQLCQVRSGTASASLPPAYSFNDGVIESTYDTDYYRFTLDTDQSVSITGQTEFPPSTRITFGCPDTEIARGPGLSPECSGVYPLSFTTTTLVAGTYYFVISPPTVAWSANTCAQGNRYWFSITGSQPCPGSCCTGTTCTASTQAACTGSFQSGAACGAPGNPTTCCPANFNGANGLNVQDIFDFLSAWFTSAPAADFNHAGGITVQDIFDFLSAWFTGC